MSPIETYDELLKRGVVLDLQDDQIRCKAPRGALTEDLLREVRDNKPAIVSIIKDRKLGDGKVPPLDRPPQTRQELERLMDYLEYSNNFLRWFEWAMNYRDPSEK